MPNAKDSANPHGFGTCSCRKPVEAIYEPPVSVGRRQFGSKEKEQE